jgi:hypothetical protein
MSVGGVFTLISNNGIQDKLLMATDQLMQNVKRIGCQKLQVLRTQFPGLSDTQLLAKDEDWMPTLAAIERTHIVYINATFKPFVAIAHEYSKTVPRGGKATLGATFSFTFPIIGEFVNDAVMYVQLSGLSAVSALDKVRYVELLAHRLVQKVSFKIKNQELDSYTSDNYNAYYQFKLPVGKEQGYLRSIGQEIPNQGYLTADPTVDEIREYRYFGNGPQTFKNVQGNVDLWIPILFWFKDLQCSLPNFVLPMQQTEIEVTFANQSQLIAFADYGGGGAYNIPVVSSCCLYLNHIFLLPEINKIFIARYGFQLIRVHRNHTQVLNESSKSLILHQLKWPIECMYIAFRPQVNLANSQTWHLNTACTDVSVKEAVVTGVATILVNNAIFTDQKRVVSSLELRASDIIIYPSLQPEFYNNYIPYRYGTNMKTPKDLGWFMMNFNFYPGDQQPSGHFNCSRARELYLSYVSAIDPAISQPYIRPANPVDLIVVADCLNFLLCKDTNAVLRFST